MIDSFLISFSQICSQLLPIIGAIVLIMLCVAMKKLWALIEKISDVVSKTEPTIDLVDKSIEKLQAPLNTAEKYSHTLDDIHDKAVDSVSKAAVYASENASKAKNVLSDSFEKVSKAFSKTEDKPQNINAYTKYYDEEEKKDPFARDQKIYDEVAKYSAKENNDNE